MGAATIIAGGPNGRYVVKVDLGESTRQALLTAATAAVNAAELKLAQAQASVAEADTAEAGLMSDVLAATQAYIDQINAARAAGGTPPSANAWTGVRLLLTEARKRHFPLRLALDARRFELASARRRAAVFNQAQTEITKEAWCVDATETGTPGALVGTIDIPGETALQLIAPGCRGWRPADGQFVAPELLSPAQAFFNTAIVPGWQKWKPTYRWGTLTSVDAEAGTGSVALFDQRSSAQGLGVNQSSVLANVAIEYMTCGADAFKAGDRVVVQFFGLDWSQPRVIGFLDNPRPCSLWPQSIHMPVVAETITGPLGSRAWGVLTSADPCGIRWHSRGTATVAPSATHRIYSAEPYFTSPATGYEIEVIGGQYGTLWTDSSDAYAFGSDSGSGMSRVPASGSQGRSLSFTGIDGNVGVTQSQTTWVDSYSAATGYSGNPLCEPTGYDTAGTWAVPGSRPTITTSALIPETPLAAWLTGIGAMPASVIVTRTSTGVRRRYVAQSARLSGGDSGVVFVPGPYL